jgi:outer membrane receptor protein involved in Fe transport
MPAGDVRFAASANYREDRYSYSPDKALAEQDVQAVIASGPTSGSTDVTELAVEFEIPILDTLSLGAAYRYSDYDLSGGTNTYKLDAMFRPMESLLLRAGFQRAIRAPNIQELFAAAQGGQVGFGDPTNDPNSGEPCDIRTNDRINDTSGNLRQLCIDTGVPANVVDAYIFPTTATAGLTSGNVNLTPEEADTITLGAVYTADIADNWNLFVSADYFNIEIADVISVIPGLTALNNCYNAGGANPTYDPNNAYCQLIDRDSNGLLVLIRTPFFNLGGLKTSGVDLNAKLTTETGIGEFSVDTAITFLDSYEIQTLPGEDFRDEAGTMRFFGIPRPDVRAMTTFGYTRNALDLSLRWRWIASMDDQSILTNPNTTTPGVDSYSKFDLIGRYQLKDNLSVRAGITNLLDEDARVVAGVPGITDTQTYDLLGRSYYVGASVEF